MIIRYDGSRWETINKDIYPSLMAMDGLSKDSIGIVGLFGEFLLYDDDGQNIQEIETGISTSLYALEMLNENYILVVGANGLILHYDGIQCDVQNTNTKSDLMDIHCEAPDECYAVGDDGVILKGSSW